MCVSVCVCVCVHVVHLYSQCIDGVFISLCYRIVNEVIILLKSSEDIRRGNNSQILRLFFSWILRRKKIDYQGR